MKFINLTRKTISIEMENDEIFEIKPSGDVAKVQLEDSWEEGIGMIPVYHIIDRKIVGLPDPQPGVIYIVSSWTEAVAERKDVFAPGDIIRDQSGRPVGCRGLKQTKVKK